MPVFAFTGCHFLSRYTFNFLFRFGINVEPLEASGSECVQGHVSGDAGFRVASDSVGWRGRMGTVLPSIRLTAGTVPQCRGWPSRGAVGRQVACHHAVILLLGQALSPGSRKPRVCSWRSREEAGGKHRPAPAGPRGTQAPSEGSCLAQLRREAGRHVRSPSQAGTGRRRWGPRETRASLRTPTSWGRGQDSSAALPLPLEEDLCRLACPPKGFCQTHRHSGPPGPPRPSLCSLLGRKHLPQKQAPLGAGLKHSSVRPAFMRPEA